MKNYTNLVGNSNVQSYEIGDHFIAVKFNGANKIYVYSYSSAGAKNVDLAKELAEKGFGLNSHIMLNMRADFER